MIGQLYRRYVCNPGSLPVSRIGSEMVKITGLSSPAIPISLQTAGRNRITMCSLGMKTVLLAEAERAVAYMTLKREDLESGDWVCRHAEDVRYMAPLCPQAAIEYRNIVIEWDGSRWNAFDKKGNQRFDCRWDGGHASSVASYLLSELPK
jgi:hypothetical protein